jgi:hypothetical protein
MKILESIITAIFILTSIVSAEPAKSSSSRKNQKDPLAEQLGKEITLVGVAHNLKVGARLSGENFTIFIDGIYAWPEEMYGKKVSVTGTLIERHDLPVFVQEPGRKNLRSGIPVPKGTDLHAAAHRYLLKDAKWVVIPESK